MKASTFSIPPVLPTYKASSVSKSKRKDHWSKTSSGKAVLVLLVVLLLLLFSLSVYLGFKMLYSSEERDRLEEIGAPNTRNIVAKWSSVSNPIEMERHPAFIIASEASNPDSNTSHSHQVVEERDYNLRGRSNSASP